MPTPKKKRRRYTKLRIDETSAVDKPAQEGAVSVALFKRAPEFATGGLVPGGQVTILGGDGREGFANTSGYITTTGTFPMIHPTNITNKGYIADEPALTDAVEGHTHIVDLSSESGYTSWEGEHSHPFVASESGVIIGESDGHTHEIEVSASKTAGNGNNDNGDPMSDEEKKVAADAAKAAKERTETLEKNLATQTALASMTDAQKSHYATLSGEAAEGFLAADPGDRSTQVEAAKAADAVVYVSKTDKTEYRASDDPRLVTLAKRDDEREVELAKAKNERETEVYKARASKELAHLPGDEATQVALLKAVDSIEDETVRKAATEILHAKTSGEVFRRAGTAGEDASGGDAEVKLDKMATAYSKEHGVTFIKAYNAVSKDGGEGQALFNETLSQPVPVVG